MYQTTLSSISYQSVFHKRYTHKNKKKWTVHTTRRPYRIIIPYFHLTQSKTIKNTMIIIYYLTPSLTSINISTISTLTALSSRPKSQRNEKPLSPPLSPPPRKKTYSAYKERLSVHTQPFGLLDPKKNSKNTIQHKTRYYVAAQKKPPQARTLEMQRKNAQS